MYRVLLVLITAISQACHEDWTKYPLGKHSTQNRCLINVHSSHPCSLFPSPPSFFLLSLPFSPSPPLSSLLSVVELIFTGKDHGDLDRKEIDSGHYEGRREKSENRQSAGSKWEGWAWTADKRKGFAVRKCIGTDSIWGLKRSKRYRSHASYSQPLWLNSGEGNGNPVQCSCLENPHGQKSLVG